MDAVKKQLAEWGSKGGRVRAQKLSAARRREIAKLGGKARQQRSK